jgi:hypothetical protein
MLNAGITAAKSSFVRKNNDAVMAQMQIMVAKWLCCRCTGVKQVAEWLCRRCTGTKHGCEAVVQWLHNHKTWLRNGCAAVAQIQNMCGRGCAMVAQVQNRCEMRLCRFFYRRFSIGNAILQAGQFLIFRWKNIISMAVWWLGAGLFRIAS